MCELMGNEPDPEQVPIDFNDFPVELQQAFGVYRMLQDQWDSIGGNYLGKSLIGVKDLLEVSEIDPEDNKFIIMLVKMIDTVRANEINSKTKEPAN